MNNENLKPVAGLQPFKRICMTIGELPSSYLETMSYYEMLVWFTKYLGDTVIPTVNNNAECIEELQQKYIELKSYVDNYFENLDVQEEINNKLDEMAESGELENILLHYTNTARIYNTTQDMIDDASNLADNQKVKTYGYYEVNDGGEANFIITDTANNNKIQIDLQNGLYAELVYDNTIYSKQIGLKGDGITDETTLLNNFYNKEIDANKVLNKGTYLITDTLYIKGAWNTKKQTFKFDNSSILYNGDTNGCSVCFHYIYGGVIDGLVINTNSVNNYINFIGCWLTNINNFDVKEIGIRYNHSSFDITGSNQGVEHLHFSNGRTLGSVYIESADKYCNGIYFTNCFISGTNHSSNVVILSANSNQEIVFDNCDLSYANDSVFDIQATQTGKGSITTKNCYFDSAIPYFKNNTQNKIIYNDFGSYNASGSINNIFTLKVSDYMKNINLFTATSNGNSLPTGNVNLVYNGNIENPSNVSTRVDRIFGISDDYVTKEYVTSNSNVNGNALRLTFNTDSEDSKQLYFDSLPAPITNIYSCAIRCKKVSGDADITVNFAGNYYKYTKDMVNTNDEVILTTRMNFDRIISAGENTRGSITVTNNDSLVLEIYEIIVNYGNVIELNLPLHKNSQRYMQFKIDSNGDLNYRKYSPQAYTNDTGWGAWKVIQAS